jgi:hypothetical protein
LVEAVALRDRDLGSQIRRAVSSDALNLSEGFGSAAGDARLRFESARGSLYKRRRACGLPSPGDLSSEACACTLEALDRLAARVFGLSRR